MAEDVKVPGVGTVPKKYAIGGVLVVGTLIGVYYYRKRKSAAATPAATSTDQYPPDGTVGNPSDPYSTDPATGQTYGDEAVGSGGTFGAFSGTGGTGSTGTGTGTGTSGPPFADNASWSNYVIQQMQANNPSTDPGALTDALGLYLNGQPVDSAQSTLIFDAIAIAGDPPVAGPNGYPPKLQTNGNPGGGVTADNPVKGLKATAEFDNVTGTWQASNNATHYNVKLTTDKGQGVASQTVAGTSAIFHGLKQKTNYAVHVLATPAAPSAREAVAYTSTK